MVTRSDVQQAVADESISRTELILKACEYTQRYWDNQPTVVVVTADDIYIGRRIRDELVEPDGWKKYVRNEQRKVVLDSPLRVAGSTTTDFSVEPHSDTVLEVLDPHHVFHPVFTDISVTHLAIIHDTVENEVHRVELPMPPVAPLADRAVTQHYPHTVEYHVAIGHFVYDWSIESIVERTTVDLDFSADTLVDGWIGRRIAPRTPLTQPITGTLEPVPKREQPLHTMPTIVSAQQYAFETTVDVRDDSLAMYEYVEAHPALDIRELSLSGHFAPDKIITDALPFWTAWSNAKLQYGLTGVAALTLTAIGREDFEAISHLVEREDADEDRDEEDDTVQELTLGQEDFEGDSSALLVYGRETDNQRVIRNPSVVIGSHAIPLHALITDEFNKYDEDELFAAGVANIAEDISLSDDVDIDLEIPDEYNVLLLLLRNYNREQNTLTLKPIARQAITEPATNDEKYNVVVDVPSQQSDNFDATGVDAEFTFLNNRPNPTHPALANRANLAVKEKVSTVIVDDPHGQWYASTKLFDESLQGTMFNVRLNEDIHSYVPVTVEIDPTICEVDGMGASAPVTVIADGTEISTTLDDNVLTEQADDSEQNEQRHRVGTSNSALSEAIGNGLLLPPLTTSVLQPK